MIKTLVQLFTPRSSNNYKAKTLHLSSLSLFMLIIMVSQIFLSLIGKAIPGVLGAVSTVTAEELVELTNHTRQQNGLPPLEIDPVLIQAAQQKGADMMAHNYWAHTSPEGKTPWYFFKQADYQYLYAGENLARDFFDSDAIVRAWMKSPTHRENILSERYHDIGIAVIQGSFQGQDTTLVVQLFGTELGQLLPQRLGDIGYSADSQIAQLELEEQVAGLKDKLPLLNSFQLTKAMSISLTVILLIAIIIDTAIVSQKKIIRLSGKSLAHLTFLGILLVILIFINQGLIL